MRTSNTIVLASNNDHKLEEFKQLFASFPEIEIVPAHTVIRNAEKIGLVEKYDQFEANSLAKARLANQASHYPCLADDSGLEVEALEGAPGVKSHRYAIAKAGQNQDQANREKLLDALKGRPMDARGARFVCVLTLVIEGVALQGRGELLGKIAEAPQGTSGFGYDPIFIPEGSSQTLAELSSDEKNQISHRAKAVRELIQKIQTRGILLAKP